MVETIATVSAVHEAFARRCAQLNIPVWLCDAAGGLISAPSIPTNGLDTSAVAEHIAQRGSAFQCDLRQRRFYAISAAAVMKISPGPFRG